MAQSLTLTDLREVSTAPQIAEYFGTTEAALAQDRHLGRGLPYVRWGRRIRYLRPDLIAYFAAASEAQRGAEQAQPEQRLSGARSPNKVTA